MTSIVAGQFRPMTPIADGRRGGSSFWLKDE
jgi:hypothetical protein